MERRPSRSARLHLREPEPGRNAVRLRSLAGAPRAVAAVLGAVVIGVALFLRGGALEPRRAAAWVPNRAAAPVHEAVRGTVRLVYQPEAPLRLVPDDVPPWRPALLLWYNGRPTQPLAGGSIVVDSAGDLLLFDKELRARRPAVALKGRHLASAAAGPGGGFWLADATGELLLADSEGHVEEVLQRPYAYPVLASDPAGQSTWAVRSPRQFVFRWDSAPAPVASPVSASSCRRKGVGTPMVPSQFLLTDFANSGHLAVSDSALYFAPFIRDEVLALRPNGDTLWLTRRGLGQSTQEPAFEVVRGEVAIDYHPVNLGAVLGPDRNLYILSTAGRTTDTTRLDVLDPATGRLLRSARLPTATPTLAVDRGGRVYALDPVRLLAAIAPRRRDAFPQFALPRLGGGTLSSAELRGHVVLVNVWASWCAPCRVEMPALDTLRRRISDTGFRFVTINEDNDTNAAREFVERYGFTFPVLLGRGAMRDQAHYPGLPYTFLLDRDGKVAGRWIGFAGPKQLELIEGAIHRELRRSPDVTHSH